MPCVHAALYIVSITLCGVLFRAASARVAWTIFDGYIPCALENVFNGYVACNLGGFQPLHNLVAVLCAALYHSFSRKTAYSQC